MGIQINGQTDTVTSTTAGGSVKVTPLAASTGLNVGTGASISSPATNVLTLGTNNSERVRIDSSGQFGINVTSPTAKFQINSQDGLLADVSSVYSYIRLGSAATGESTSEFGYDRSTGANIFKQGTTGSALNERLRIDSSGNLGIGTVNPGAKLHVSGGNIKVDSGYGIDFSATANSSGTVTTEVLDDYERGTWTPSFVQPATSANIFVNNGLTIFQSDYVKIGNLVYISCYIQNDASFSYDTGRGGSDPIGVGGLPFIVSNTPTNSGYHPIYVGWYNSLSGWSAGYTPMGYFYAGTNNLGLTYASTNAIANVTAGSFSSANSAIMLSGWYRTN